MKHAIFTAFLFAATATPALAQEANDKTVSVEAEVGVVSDYRFRGVSLSDKDVAVQGGLTVTTRPGFYAGVWASNIAEFGGAKTEVDVTGGWSGPVGPFTADVNLVGYLYPDGTGVNYYEVNGSLSKEFGGLDAKLGLAYAPKQSHLGHLDNTYVYADASYAVDGTPLSLDAHAGYEKGVTAAKYDYAVGASVELAPFTLGLSYITVHGAAVEELGRLAGDTALASLKASF